MTWCTKLQTDCFLLNCKSVKSPNFTVANCYALNEVFWLAAGKNQKAFFIHGMVMPKYELPYIVGVCKRFQTKIPLIHRDLLSEFLEGCEYDEDIVITLNVLSEFESFDVILINNSTRREETQKLNLILMLSNMKDQTKIEALQARLVIRLELFRRVPTATNMLLAYNLIEEIVLKVMSGGTVDISDKVNKHIERFDKLKNLALGTKYIHERKVAFERSVEVYRKLVKV